jgi:gliding motility-associated-like protein
MIRAVLFTLIGCFFVVNSYAQKEANYWYFGVIAGVNFNTSPPTALIDGQTNWDEGTATISDKNGNLLFYTDGHSVWNKKHKVMPHGTDLIGSNSATQAALIVPFPENNKLFYVFTIHEYGHSLAYSIVDISLDNGFGDITVKNSILIKNSTEKITAVHHQNGKDVWVIAHSMDNNNFYSWLITSKGIPNTPLINSVGSQHGDKSFSGDTLYARGYMKVSSTGKNIALSVLAGESFVEVFDFNDVTGLISNPQKIVGFNGIGVYGVEFSPNGKVLYLSEINEGLSFPVQNLYQIAIPVSSGNITEKGVILGQDYGGALQCAPDGKIYWSSWPGSSALSVINNPDTLGSKSDLQFRTILFYPAGNERGLPNFIQSYFREPLTISAVGNCASDITRFTATTNVAPVDSIIWNFSDKYSDKNTISRDINPVHQYQVPGQYYITATMYNQGKASKSSLTLTIFPSPKVKLGNDTTLLYGQKLQLNATNDNSTYQWNDGSTNAFYEVNAPGTYWVNVINKSGCATSDTIKVKYDQIINVGLPKDTSFCVGQSLKLDVQLVGAKYIWSTGETTPSIIVKTAGIYWVEITNAFNNRTKRDSVSVTNYTFNNIKAVSDTVICYPSILILHAQGSKNHERYNWYDGNKNFIEVNSGSFTTPVISINTSYYVELTNGLCTGAMRQINIKYDKPVAKIANKDTIIDLGASINLIGSGGKTCQWAPSSYIKNPNNYYTIAIPLEDTTFQLIVFSENGCTDTARVKIKLKKAVIPFNAFTPNGDGVNDYWVIKYIDRYPHNNVRIYNRYGLQVANYNNYSNQWDGTYGGKPLPTGTYYYIIALDYKHKQSGSVTIIR